MPANTMVERKIQTKYQNLRKQKTGDAIKYKNSPSTLVIFPIFVFSIKT